MKLIFTLILLLTFSKSFSQWTRVLQLPGTKISSLYRLGNTLYAGGESVIYFSKDKGQTWDSTSKIPLLSSVNSIIVHKNELYATSFSLGVFKSADGGATWEDISTGVFPEVSDFTEWRGDLYAATLGNSVYKLDPVNRNSWLSFSNGLSNLSANIGSIAGNNNALVAGTLANGLYGYLPANLITWEERFLLGQISPTEGVYDIITSHDSLFIAGSTGRFYRSTDNGLAWNLFGNRLPSVFTSLTNTKQALVLARVTFDGVNNTSFYYIRKDSLQGTFALFSSAANHFTYKLEIFGDKLWDASTEGLYFMPLSFLPGITAAEDSTAGIPLPVHFTSVNAKCEGSNVIVAWKTAQEQAGSHFVIERSEDGIHWTNIGNLPGAGNNGTERSYSFKDHHPVQNALYRIGEHDLNGHVQFSTLVRSSCTPTDAVTLWPNPVHDQLFIRITAAKESKALIKIFDSKGALCKTKTVNLMQGNNQVQIDMQSLPGGIYEVLIDRRQMQNKSRVLKQ